MIMVYYLEIMWAVWIYLCIHMISRVVIHMIETLKAEWKTVAVQPECCRNVIWDYVELLKRLPENLWSLVSEPRCFHNHGVLEPWTSENLLVSETFWFLSSTDSATSYVTWFQQFIYTKWFHYRVLNLNHIGSWTLFVCKNFWFWNLSCSRLLLVQNTVTEYTGSI